MNGDGPLGKQDFVDIDDLPLLPLHDNELLHYLRCEGDLSLLLKERVLLYSLELFHGNLVGTVEAADLHG